MTQTTTERRTHRSPPERVPPHNLEAEESLLGAMLLTGAAIAAAVDERASAGDFYKPTHGHIFDAIVMLWGKAEPVDPVTVADELRRADLLDDTGGLPALLSLEARTPATSNAGHYARIVVEHAALRQLIGVGDAITALGYALPEDIPTTLEHATGLIGGVSERVVTAGRQALEWEPLGAALRGEEPEVVPELLYRSDDRALIYPGRLHWIQAEPGRAKSWVALLCVIEQLTFGCHVVYLDYESNRTDVGKRLRKLGLEVELAEEFLHYARPGAHTPAVAAQLGADMERWRPALCVLDGVAKSLQRNGYHENERDEVGIWVDKVCRPVTNSGVALVAIDHVTKNPESRGRYAVGGGNKLAEVDGAAYSMKRIRALSHSQAGEYQLIVEKDKEGSVAPEGEVAAVLHMEEDSAGHISHRLLAPTPENTEHPGMRIIRDRIVAFLAARPTQEFTVSALKNEIRGKGSAVGECLAQLVESGDVACHRQGSSVLHRLADRGRGGF